jgi:hypothetical protein
MPEVRNRAGQYTRNAKEAEEEDSLVSNIIHQEFELFRDKTLEKLNSALTTDPDDAELSRAKTDLKNGLAEHFGTHVASTVTTAWKNGWNSYMQANSKRKYEEFRSESGTRLHVCADDRYEQKHKIWLCFNGTFQGMASPFRGREGEVFSSRWIFVGL